MICKSKFFNAKNLIRNSSLHFSTNDSKPILFEYPHKDICDVYLNRPKALNSLSLELLELLNQEVTKWNERDSEVKLTIFQGKGTQAFSSGRDVKSIYQYKDKPDEEKYPFIERFVRTELTTEYNLSQMKPIQLSLWNGITMGGGLGISVHSEIRIATENTLAAMPVAAIGYFADDGGSYFLSRMKKNLGFYLGLMGARLKGADAVRAGAANYFIKSEKLESYVKEIRAQTGRITLENLLDISSSYSEKVDNTFPHEDEIGDLLAGNDFKVIYERLQRKSESSPVAKDMLEKLKRQSPLSVMIIFEQLRRARDLSLEECYVNDFVLGQHVVRKGDFFEGVRATLVNREVPPNWKYKSVLDISKEDVEEFFKPMPGLTPLRLNQTN